jgi:hypothetical protein
MSVFLRQEIAVDVLTSEVTSATFLLYSGLSHTLGMLLLPEAKNSQPEILLPQDVPSSI